MLDIERQRRKTSRAEIVREALTAYLTGEGTRSKPLRFAGLGRSGRHDTAREAEAILGREWDTADDR